jgi:predicted MPP superfamily phosphohydrolase
MERRRISRRQLLRRGIALASLTTLSGTVYTTLVEPGWIEVNRLALALPHLDSAFCGFRVVQISDIHMGDWMDATRFGDVVRLANAQSPDLVAITGDFVTRHPTSHARDLVDGLSRLEASEGIMAVLGNHDHWSDPQAVRDILHTSGVRELANAVRTIQRGEARLHIAGVDDIWEELDRLDIVLDALPDDGAAILLAHEPDFADTSAATGRFDLQLSGHSHGGQIALPFIGPLHVPQFSRRYPIGQYQVGEMVQYTNRGVGMIRPFVRFNCRPEITVFELHARQGCNCGQAQGC